MKENMFPEYRGLVEETAQFFVVVVFAFHLFAKAFAWRGVEGAVGGRCQFQI